MEIVLSAMIVETMQGKCNGDPGWIALAMIKIGLNKMAKKQMNVAVEESDRAAFAELCRRYNLSMASAVNMIICACIESGRLPFEFVEKAKETSRETR